MQDKDKPRQSHEELASLQGKAAPQKSPGAEVHQAVAQQRLAGQILERLNQATPEANVVRDILLLLKDFTGMEAVGLRLNENDDYPYYETNGFPQDFLKRENFLCARDASGKVLLDGKGLPVLDCMCGNIIRGRVDPSLPFFSEGGSFWTNSTTRLLASTTEKDRQARTRNYCNTAGYESVALIPLRSHRGIVGLLQLNDHRRDLFTPALIAFYEGIASNIGVALSRKRSEEELQRSALQWQTTFDAMDEAIYLLDTKQRIRNCNRAACALSGKSRGEMVGRHCWEIMHGAEGPIQDCPHLRAMGSGKRESLVIQHGDRTLGIAVDPVRNGDGAITGYVHIAGDITEQKRAEQARIRSERMLRAIFDGARDGILVADAETRQFVIANEAVSGMLGYSCDEILRLGVKDIHPEKDLPQVVEQLGRQIRGEIALAAEIPVKRKDGSVFYADINSTPVELGGRPCVIGVFRDVTDRRRSEAERDRLARQHQLALDAARMGWWHYDPATRIATYDERYQDIFGVTGHQRPNEEILARLHPDDLPRVWAAVEAALNPADPKPYSTEYRVNHPDGSVRWVEAHGIASFEGEGDGRRATNFVGTVQDITERKKAEARIAHLNAALKGIRNVNQLITREKGRDRLIQQACDLLVEARGFHSVVIGLTDGPGGKVGMHAGAGRKLPALRECFERGEMPDCARRAMEGRHVVVRINPEKSCLDCPGASNPASERDVLAIRLEQDRKVYGFMVACLPSGMGNDPEEQALLGEAAGDIAFALRGIQIEVERDRSVSALRENAETLRVVADFAYDWEYWRDEDGSLLYMSPSCERITGYAVEEFRRDPDLIRRIVRPEDLPAVMKHEEETKRTDEPCGVDYRIVTKSGGEKWIGHRCVPVFCDGKRRGRRATNRDITERVLAEKRLAETEAQLRQAQKLDAIGRLAGGVAHDFNNLLTVINGYSEILLSKMKPDDPNRGPVEEIAGSGERAASLTRQLLAFSRKQAVKPVVLDINRIVSNMEKMIRRLIGEDIEVVTGFELGLGCIQADPGQVEQVIVNLVVNARDAMPQGGKLVIETKNVELDEAYSREHVGVRPGPHVMLAVSDTGIGMDAEIQSHLFEPFFTTKEAGKGTGLGLSTVHGIVKQGGGHIWIYSEVGKGTTFKIYYPRTEKVDEPDRRGRPSALGRRAVTETVLLVEDMEAVRRMAREVLAQAGYTVLEAASGEEAMGVLKGHGGPIHLLLTDSMLPVMSGRELAVHAAALRRGIKVLYTSGHTDRALQANGMLERDEHFLPKPFTAESLLPKVREVLDSEGPAQS